MKPNNFSQITNSHAFHCLKSPSLDLNIIEFFVCKAFKISPSKLRNSNHLSTQEFVKPRQIFHYLAVKYTTKRLYQIGLYYRKDHSTVLNSSNTISNLIFVKDKEYYPIILSAENLLINYLQTKSNLNAISRTF